MPTVRVLPLEVDVEVAEGESLMAAARRQGYHWPTVCGGNCECGTCWVLVEAGAEHCSPVGRAEQETLARGIKANEPRARLGCQLKVEGRVLVYRRGVRITESLPQ